MSDTPHTTAPIMLLEEQQRLTGQKWRSGIMDRQISDRKALIYNILEAIPMQARTPGMPILAPAAADQERGIAAVMQKAQAKHLGNLEGKRAEQQSKQHKPGKAPKAIKWSLESIRRVLTCNTADFERNILGWGTQAPAMLGARKVGIAQAGPSSCS